MATDIASPILSSLVVHKTAKGSRLGHIERFMIHQVVEQILETPPPSVAPKPRPKPTAHPSEPAVEVVHLSDEEEEEEQEQNDDESPVDVAVDVAVDVPAPSESSSLRRPRELESEDEADESDLQLPAESQQEEGMKLCRSAFCTEGNSLNVVLAVGGRLGNCDHVIIVRNVSSCHKHHTQTVMKFSALVILQYSACHPFDY